jgi:hypothetical protein
VDADHPSGLGGRSSNGHALSGGVPAQGNGHRGKPLVGSPKPILTPGPSATLRDRFLAELDGIQSTDEAGDWAFRNLPAKNSLTAEDAGAVEAKFQAQLAAVGTGEPSDEPLAGPQRPNTAQPDDQVKQKDRLAAVPPKSDDILVSGGCDGSGALLRPAINEKAETGEDSDQHRPSRGQRGCRNC